MFCNYLLFNDIRAALALDAAERPLSLSKGKPIAISSASLLNNAGLKCQPQAQESDTLFDDEVRQHCKLCDARFQILGTKNGFDRQIV
jgi:hypothetical protein